MFVCLHQFLITESVVERPARAASPVHLPQQFSASNCSVGRPWRFYNLEIGNVNRSGAFFLSCGLI